ncbi:MULTISPECIES: phosphatase PAP2 family protein [Streptomyces]|uniref:Phosphatase PAP2 family protein n=2 Tax=Streptomyces TaxID=1883 RepID=A0ABD5F0B4_9ACTN|nr:MULTISPECIES: phosphatase PAP2 family protein [unclassified Streptomyces]MDT0439857.1 phosphatase PAP2 family protein [Streptomyces sp. DSM 41981]MYQ62015.1 phosphatase PAP2 family protein [Streptomyces sp. SID4950]SCD28519.1 undecaprenyl-diphosphatase [Streptomyces sp. SolWspMP-5a-2]
MHPRLVDSPPHPQDHRSAPRAAAALAALSALLLALVAAGWRPLTEADGDLAGAAHRRAVAEPGVTHAVRVLSDWVWDPWTMRLLCAVVVVLLVVRWADRWTAVWLAAACALGALLQQALKAAVDRPRPVWPDPVATASFAAFPSGHAMTATVVCGLLLWLLRRRGTTPARWRAALAAGAVSVLGVGLTRIWLGVHWPSDVLGGWLLGATVVAAAVTVHRRLHPAGRGGADPTGGGEKA